MKEYERRGCPLRKTAWGIQNVCRFMKVYLQDKERGQDLGAYGYFFSRGTTMEPSPMPEFIARMDKGLFARDDAAKMHVPEDNRAFSFLNF